MTKNFEIPEEDKPQGPPVTCTVLGVKEGSSKREVLFESEDFAEFEKAYKYYYKSGKYIAVFKEFNHQSGGIL